MKKPTEIESTLKIGKVYCNRELFGTETSIQINGHRGILAFPEFPAGYEHSVKTLGCLLDPPKNATIKFDSKDTEWGTTSYNSADDGAWLNAVRVWFPLESNEKTIKERSELLAKEINAYIEKWFEAFSDSIEVLSWQTINFPITRKVIEPKLVFACWDENGYMNKSNLPIKICDRKDDPYMKPLTLEMISFANLKLTH